MSYYFKKNHRPDSKKTKTTINNLLNDLFFNSSLPEETDYFNDLDDYPVQANVIAREKETVIELLTPGIPKEDINIECNNGKLFVSYKAAKEESIEGDYIQQQIFKDGFKNTFKLTSELDSEKISASMNNGILEIKIPRRKGKSVNKIKID